MSYHVVNESTDFVKKLFELHDLDHVPYKLIEACLESIEEHNDKAHDIHHVVDVIVTGSNMIPILDLCDEMKEAFLLSCLMHDLGCRYDRKTHHIHSASMSIEMFAKYYPEVNFKVKRLTRYGCLEHRSSFKGVRSLIGDLTNIADKGTLDLNEMILRSIRFHKKGKELNDRHDLEAIAEEVVKHFKEKYGTDGYAWKSLPEVGKKLLKNEIEYISKEVDKDNFKNKVIRTFLTGY